MKNATDPQLLRDLNVTARPPKGQTMHVQGTNILKIISANNVDRIPLVLDDGIP